MKIFTAFFSMICILISLGSFHQDIYAQVLEQDSLALVALYDSTDGDNWFTNENWKTDSLVSTWSGIFVLDGRVMMIALPSNNLKGTIPQEIGNLTALVAIMLIDNQLTGTIPLELGNLTDLQMVALDYNQLTGAAPSQLSTLINLGWLSLSSNQLTGEFPSELVVLDSLSNLYINDNKFTGLPDLTSLTLLDTLNVSDNRLTFEDIEPNVGISGFVYSPQDSVGESQDIIAYQDSGVILSVTVGGTYNQYQWYKDSTEIEGADSSVFLIESVTWADSGAYICQITNSIATGLTLYSAPIHVHIMPVTDIGYHAIEIPDKFSLNQNYPNPFNPETTISYTIASEGFVNLVIYDILGRKVKILVNQPQNAGHYSINVNGHQLSSGIYFYKLNVDASSNESGQNITKIRKMMLVR
jgi:hypothetical protein